MTISFKDIPGFKMVIIREKYNIHSTTNRISELFDFTQRHYIKKFSTQLNTKTSISIVSAG